MSSLSHGFGRIFSPKTPQFYVGIMSLLSPQIAFAEATSPQIETALSNLTFTVGNLWIQIASILVFLMHLGFAAIEAGSVQKKNVANILFKNTAIIAIGILTYALVGFNLMYPGADFAGAVFGFAGFGIDEAIGLVQAVKGLNVIGGDVVCLMPTKDSPNNITAMVAASVAYEILSQIAWFQSLDF